MKHPTPLHPTPETNRCPLCGGTLLFTKPSEESWIVYRFEKRGGRVILIGARDGDTYVNDPGELRCDDCGKEFEPPDDFEEEI